MADRYFVETPIDREEARLVGAEAHHLAHVMRAKAGHEVLLFDGSGCEFQARVEQVGRSEIVLAIVARAAVDRELSVPLSLGVALPKGDRQRWLVEKAVELGVTRLVPLECERSNDRTSTSSLDRLRRAVIEASKQCGRNRLLEIAPPQPLAEFLADAPDALRLFAHPGGEACQSVLDAVFRDPHPPRHVVLAVGPEGGFTEAEVALASGHSWRAADLGRRILRIETAALTLAAAIALHIPPADSEK